MTQAVIGLAIAYVALGVVVLGLTVRTHWPVWVKAVSILLVSSMFFFNYLSLGRLQGWPSSANLPERFHLIASFIKEPDKQTGSSGTIYIWANSLAGNLPAAEPRAYALQYSSDLHKQLKAADERMRDGVMQLGKSEWVDDGTATGSAARLAEKRKLIRIYDLPNPEMPEK